MPKFKKKKMKYEQIVGYIAKRNTPFTMNDVRRALGFQRATINYNILVLKKAGLLRQLDSSKVRRNVRHEKTDDWCAEKADLAIKQDSAIKHDALVNRKYHKSKRKKMKYELVIEYIEKCSKPFMMTDMRLSLGLVRNTINVDVGILRKAGLLKRVGQIKLGKFLLHDKTDDWSVEKAESAIKQSFSLAAQKYSRKR